MSACYDISFSAAMTNVAAPQRLQHIGVGARPLAQWAPGSRAAARSGSADSEQCSLACDEDSISPEVVAAAPVEHARAKPPLVPASSVYIAVDVQEIIRNDLDRQRSLGFVPQRDQAQRFATTDRPRVVSWLVEVVSALGLTKETLHVAVSLLDRFIAATEEHPPESMLQLLALACISIASKHEEVSQNSSEDWVRLAVQDGRQLYERVDLQRMECQLLETVEWRIRVPNTLTFLRHYYHVLMNTPAGSAAVPRDPGGAAGFKTCAHFLAELSLLYSDFLPYGYSTVASACLVLAEWTAKGTAAAVVDPSAPRALPAIQTVAALTSAAGVDVTFLAPNLALCVEALHRLYTQATAGGPERRPPSAKQLGLLAPVVARYMQVS